MGSLEVSMRSVMPAEVQTVINCGNHWNILCGAFNHHPEFYNHSTETLENVR